MQYDTACINNDDTPVPMLVYEYISTGRRNVGRPRKRWIHQHPWRGNKPRMVDMLCS